MHGDVEGGAKCALCSLKIVHFALPFFYLFSVLTPRKGKDTMAFASLITSYSTADRRASSSVVTSICGGSSGELVCMCVAECLGEIGEW